MFEKREKISSNVGRTLGSLPESHTLRICDTSLRSKWGEFKFLADQWSRVTCVTSVQGRYIRPGDYYKKDAWMDEMRRYKSAGGGRNAPIPALGHQGNDGDRGASRGVGPARRATR
jgi:hypothetical protein